MRRKVKGAKWLEQVAEVVTRTPTVRTQLFQALSDHSV